MPLAELLRWFSHVNVERIMVSKQIWQIVAMVFGVTQIISLHTKRVA